MSARLPFPSRDLRANCVSHVLPENYEQNLHDYRHILADCVSHPLETKSGLRGRYLAAGGGRRELLARDQHAPLQPLPLLGRPLALAPRGTRLPMPLPLALEMSADLLAVTRPAMRLKPAATDPARALLHHGRLLPRSSSPAVTTRGVVSLLGQWVSSGEQTWVNPG
jgi:hypothetical protein